MASVMTEAGSGTAGVPGLLLSGGGVPVPGNPGRPEFSGVIGPIGGGMIGWRAS